MNVTAADVRAALELRHPEEEGEWVVLHEALRIDTLAIRCWGGRRGHQRIAYEIKVSKSDLDAELRRPQKRQRAWEISDEFYFAMPWDLASRHASDIDRDLGVIGVVPAPRTTVGYTARVLRRSARTPARPLTAEELSTVVRWRAQPPALRNALIERAQRNEDVRRLRNQLAVATKALAELALREMRPGVELRPAWSDYGVRIVSEPRLERGRVKVKVTRSLTSLDLDDTEHDEDLGYLLGLGYEIVREQAEAA